MTNKSDKEVREMKKRFEAPELDIYRFPAGIATGGLIEESSNCIGDENCPDDGTSCFAEDE